MMASLAPHNTLLPSDKAADDHDVIKQRVSNAGDLLSPTDVARYNGLWARVQGK